MTRNSRNLPLRLTASCASKMRAILHILTRPEDELTSAVIAGQRALPETTVEVADLTSPAPDYKAVVEKIFTADSVQVW